METNLKYTFEFWTTPKDEQAKVEVNGLYIQLRLLRALQKNLSNDPTEGALTDIATLFGCRGLEYNEHIHFVVADNCINEATPNKLLVQDKKIVDAFKSLAEKLGFKLFYTLTENKDDLPLTIKTNWRLANNLFKDKPNCSYTFDEDR